MVTVLLPRNSAPKQMVSARPRRDNTLFWQRSRKRAPPNLQRPRNIQRHHRLETAFNVSLDAISQR
jgi:hypothetical protein